MAKKSKTRQHSAEDILNRKLDRLVALNEDSLIIQLILKKVGLREIRKILGVATGRITRISKEIKEVTKRLEK